MNTERYPETDAEKLFFKQALKQACLKILNDRVANIEQAMFEARESANSEEKSSAGDKYETSRAMGHLAQEMQSKQLEEARQELDLINRLNTDNLNAVISPGSVVICSGYIFYLSLGLGHTQIDGQKIMLLSPKAPIANLLFQKRAGETFIFNSKSVQILSVF